jgi:hypothetical protein
MGRSSGDGRMPRRPELDYLHDEQTREALRAGLREVGANTHYNDYSADDTPPTSSPSGTKGPEPLH